ncbi:MULTISPECIES: YdhK family protein [Bacillaceae]|jgi:hypothetical protein|uniref:YdhK family protein n=1 Tax=Bacillaceae TaxID=186817 RepID=UPI000D56101D|nr:MULTISPECIES: YdhK family protein [Bacillaceae]AWI12593.1 hypothetical protein CQJ30_10750 [Caldibacillus thermoamylovorans]MBU5344167.1 YdhK family protein [Caldifermentibacillus hisashii]MCU9599890.1 YdhK family protein [Pallidibacillus thermolactis subsp. kokeshiiformis]
MKKQKVVLGISSMLLIFLLSACANGGEPSQNENADNETETQENVNNSEEESDSTGEMDHSEMNHSGGEVPQGLTEAENPTYPVGSKVILHADHMAGMNGAEATVSGAFDTTVYSVTYTPTTGGEPVEDHKWVVHEEIENPSEESYKPGDQVVLNAEHMKGMDGATATIDTAEQTTVYMVDYTDEETGEQITNHMWVTEDELSPVE